MNIIEAIIPVVSALFGSVITFLLTLKKQQAEVKKLEAETEKIRQETEQQKKQIETMGLGQAVALGLRSPLLDERSVTVTINDLATLLASYLVTQRLLEGELSSWGDVQSFLSRRRKNVQQFINTIIYGYFQHPKDGVFELRDILFASVLNRDFLNVDLYSVIEKARVVSDVADIENLFKRTFEKAVRHPKQTLMDCLDETVFAKYKK